MSNARNLANLLGTNTKVKDVDVDGTELVLDADGDTSIEASTDDIMVFDTGGSERMRLIDDGKLLVGKTSTGDYVSGFEVQPAGAIVSYRSSGVAGLFGRTDNGEIVRFTSNSAIIGKIGCVADSYPFFGTTTGGDVGIAFIDEQVRPVSGENGANADDAYDLGNSAVRWDDVRATNGTIQTSDQNEKQNIESLSTKESTLFKTFKWKSKVAKKGDSARTHTGMIAQEIQTAFSDEGLDVSKYAFWCSDTWWEKEVKVEAVKADKEKGIEAQDAYTHTVIEKEKTDGYTERTRLSLRYPELLSFIGAATEQRLASVEARLTALESK